jgi:hypothetical protein
MEKTCIDGLTSKLVEGRFKRIAYLLVLACGIGIKQDSFRAI